MITWSNHTFVTRTWSFSSCNKDNNSNSQVKCKAIEQKDTHSVKSLSEDNVYDNVNNQQMSSDKDLTLWVSFCSIALHFTCEL